MNTAIINHILIATILGLIITSSANASSCPSLDKNIAEIQKNTALIVDIIENAPAAGAQGGFKKVSYQQVPQLPAGQISIDEQAHPALKVLESDGILSSSPVSNVQQLGGKNLGRVVMINKCFALTVRHHVEKLAGEHGKVAEAGQRVYGAFGRSCDGSSEFKASEVAMSVFAFDNGTTGVKEDWAFLKIEGNQKQKIDDFKFPRVNKTDLALNSNLLIVGTSAENLSAKSGLKFQAVRAAKYLGGSLDNTIWSNGGSSTGGISGGGTYSPQDKELVLAGLNVSQDKNGQTAAIPIRKIFKKLYAQNKAMAEEVLASFKDQNCK